MTQIIFIRTLLVFECYVLRVNYTAFRVIFATDNWFKRGAVSAVRGTYWFQFYQARSVRNNFDSSAGKFYLCSILQVDRSGRSFICLSIVAERVNNGNDLGGTWICWNHGNFHNNKWLTQTYNDILAQLNI